MKKVLAWVLLLTLVLGAFAGCKQKPEPEVTEPPYAGAGAADAIEYLKGFYNDGGKKTPVDYTRFGIVRVGGVAFNVVWSVDVSEDLVKVVPNEDGTVTIDINEACEEDTEYTLIATVTDAQGNTATHSWTYVLPKGVDMVEVVKSAYALQPGESLPYESRLIGKIISIDAIWTEDYQNVTVTIEVEGAEDMPIKCYRMKANDSTIDAARNLKVGNIITVCGTLKNYEGTIEFDAGCMLEKVEKGDAIEAPTDPVQIVKEAYALPENATLPYQATLTGTVTGIDSPYDPQYGNISVVISIEGAEQYPILCYRLKGTGVDQIAINDLITVTGIIKNYKGTIEYDAGCVMTNRVSGGGVAQGPSSDPNKIIPDALKLAPGEKMAYRATLTGEVVSVDTPYDPGYGNVTVTMKVQGYKFQCYRMVGDGIDQIRETDTITVSGVIENYNGKLEFGAKCTLDSWVKGPRPVGYGPLKEDTAYRLYVDQKGIGKMLYFNGEYSGSRLSTSEKGSEGVDVFVERVSGKGVYFYFMDGQAKKYISVEDYTNDKGQVRGRTCVVDTPNVHWAYNSDLGVYLAEVSAGKHFMGAYNTYETISASWVGYIDGSMASSNQYVAKFMAASDVPADGPSGNTKVEGTPVAEPVVGTGYKFGFHQNQLDGKPFLGLTGEMAGFYFETSDAMADMVDVYLEAADGGYHLYIMKGNTKTYLDVVVREDDASKVNVVFTTSGTHSVYALDTEYKYVSTVVNGTEWYLGTYGVNKSISASKISYIADKSTIGVSQFCAWFCEVAEVEVEPEEPTEPDVTEPENPGTSYDAQIVTDPVVETAYKMGMDKGDGKVLYFTGNPESEQKTYRLETSTDASKAVDVYLEAADGGYRLYFMKDGVKTYIRVFHYTDGNPGYGKGSLEFVTSAPSEVFTYDETAKTLFYDYDGNNAYYMGTYGDFVTFSVSNTSYITGNKANTVDVSQFPARFYTVSESEGGEPEVTEPTTPDVTEPSTGDGFNKITSAAQFTTGKYVMIVDTGYAPGVLDGKWVSAVQPVVSGNQVTDTKDAVWTLTVKGNSVVITDASGASIAPSGGNSNGITSGSYDWAWSFKNGKFVFAGTGSDTVYLASNTVTTGQYAGNHRFRGYKTSTVNGNPSTYPYEFTMYKLGGEYVEPEVTEPTTPDVTEPSTGAAQIVTDPVAGTAYKMGMDKADGKVLYFTGNTESEAVDYRLETTNDASKAVDVYLEAVDGGYRLYFMKDGVKTYIRVYHRTDGDPGYGKGSLELVTTAPSELMIYDETAKTLIYDYDGNNAYYMGTYGTFFTFSVSNTSYITGDKASNVDVTQFPARFYTISENEGGEPETTEPEVTEPEVTEPTQPSTGTTGIVTNPVAGTAYKMGMDKADGKVLYFTGNTESEAVDYRLETTNDASKAVDVYLEAADGGYRLYFMKDGVKTYIRVYHRTDGDPGYGKGSLELVTTAPSEVMIYDETANTLFYDYDGNNAYYMGTYGTFFTFSVSNTSYITGSKASNVDVTQFPARFYIVGENEGGEPEATEPETTEPEETEPEVTEPVTGSGYVKVTDASQLTSGKYVLVVDGGYAPSTYASGWVNVVQPVVSGNQVTDTKGAVWTLTVSGNTVTITDANGVAIAPKGGNANGITNGDYQWAWKFQNGKFVFTGTGSDTVTLASNGNNTGSNPGNFRFRAYKNTTVNGQPDIYPSQFTLYKLVG
ncbi:MAG: hypothetical protein IIX23_00180 [Oscillospiraceae bacterium]|nr:hypothetical protein [Oscillospiraceae bacterium]